MRTVALIIFSLILMGACLFLALATPASALESHTLSQHSRWTVDVNIRDDGEVYCDMWTENRSGSVYLSVNSYDMYQLAFFLPGLNIPYGGREVDFDVAIHRTNWTLYDANIDPVDTNEAMVTFTFSSQKGRKLIRDIMYGQEIRIPMGTGNPDYVWSLEGSSAAVKALDDCRQKL